MTKNGGRPISFGRTSIGGQSQPDELFHNFRASYDEFYVVQECRATDFRAPKL